MHMNERLQRALDGELSDIELAPALATELEETRALFGAVVSSIPARPLPKLGVGVLQRIEALEASDERDLLRAESRPIAMGLQGSTHRSGLRGWLWSRRELSISVRPAYVLGLAAMLLIAVGIISRGGPYSPTILSPVVANPSVVLVHFRLEAPKAQTVAVAGDFNNWSPVHAMKRSEPGVWTIVIPLTPGVHDYSFIVDGEKWVPDPTAPGIPDGFGGMNSRVAVLAPDTKI
jgi:hypothetical protein